MKRRRGIEEESEMSGERKIAKSEIFRNTNAADKQRYPTISPAARFLEENIFD